MTNREALIILAAGFANQEYTAAGAVEEAVAALKLIDAHLAAQPAPVPDEADPLKLYEWAKKTARGEVMDSRDGTWPVTRRADGWTAWVTPDCTNEVGCESFEEACNAVNWPEWDRVNAQ